MVEESYDSKRIVTLGVISNLTQYESLIKDRTGLVIDPHRRGVLTDAVSDLMSKYEIISSNAFYDHIYTRANTFSELIDRLTINETFFFREPGHLDLLVNRILPPRLQNLTKNEKFRILSAGCSTGEEPYSIIMAIVEKSGKDIAEQLLVFGGDIDQTALKCARSGEYGANSFRGLKTELRQRYFNLTENGKFRIASSIKEQVIFLYLNLLRPPYPGSLKKLDVIFYRNVAIYFDAPTQSKIFDNLATILADDGYIIVSSAETLVHNHPALFRIELDGYFLFHKKGDISSHKRDGFPFTDTNQSQRNKKKVSPPLVDRESDQNAAIISPLLRNIQHSAKHDFRSSPNTLNRIRALIRKGRFDEALQLSDHEKAKDVDKKELIYLQAFARFQKGEYDDALTLSLRIVEADSLFTKGYLLIGMIDYENRRINHALKRFRQVIYLQPSNWLAHFYSAEIYHNQDRGKQAKNHYKRVLNLLEEGNFDNHGLLLFPLNFSKNELITLCNQRMLGP